MEHRLEQNHREGFAPTEKRPFARRAQQCDIPHTSTSVVSMNSGVTAKCEDGQGNRYQPCARPCPLGSTVTVCLLQELPGSAQTNGMVAPTLTGIKVPVNGRFYRKRKFRCDTDQLPTDQKMYPATFIGLLSSRPCSISRICLTCKAAYRCLRM